MSKHYVIREGMFLYNDEYDAFAGMANIKSRFTDEQEARAELQRLMRKSVREAETFQNWLFNHHDALIRVAAVLRHEFPDLLPGDPDEGADINRLYELSIPSPLTDAQADALCEAMAVPWYQLYEFDGEPQFCFLDVNGEFFGDDVSGGIHSDAGVPAMEADPRDLVEQFWDAISWHVPDKGLPGLQGSYEDLSSMPAALKAFVTDQPGIRYDESRGAIVLDEGASDATVAAALLGLAPLLDSPPWKIERHGYDAANERYSEVMNEAMEAYYC